MGEDAPFWRFSAASYPDLEEMNKRTPLQAKRRTEYQESDKSVGVSFNLFLLNVASL